MTSSTNRSESTKIYHSWNRTCKKKHEIYWACSELSSNKNAYVILLGRFERQDHLVNVGVDGRITLKPTLKKVYENVLD